MKEILFNLALIHLNQFCESQGIDYAGSHCVRFGAFRYNLIQTKTGKILASVRFHKNAVPTYQKS